MSTFYNPTRGTIISKVSRTVHCYAVLSRAKHLPLALPLFFLGVILARPGWDVFSSIYLWEGMGAVLIFFSTANILDTTFRVRPHEEAEVTNARAMLGRKHSLLIGLVQTVFLVMVTLHLSWALDQAFLVIMMTGGVLFVSLVAVRASFSRGTGIGYATVQPVGLVFFPLAGSFLLVSGSLEIMPLLVFGGLTLLFSGFAVNEQLKGIRATGNDIGSNSVEWETIQAAREMGLSRDSYLEVGAQVNNIRKRESFKAVPMDERMVFLPHCLKNSTRCRGEYTEEGLICKSCTPDCPINMISREARKRGYKVFVAPGAGLVYKLVERHNPKAAVGVACGNELKMAAAHADDAFGIPYQIVMLKKGGCVDTEVEMEDVIRVLDLGKGATAS